MLVSTPIVLIHGLIGSLQLPDLSGLLAPHRVLAPDLLGYGAQRQRVAAELSLDAQVEYLRGIVAQHFGDEPVHLVGHSVGGVVAALFACRYGARVRSLVSVEGNFSLKDAFWSARVAAMTPAEVEALLAGYRRDPAGWLAGAGVVPTAETLRVAECWLAQQPASTVQAMAQAVVAETAPAAYRDRLRALFARIPVHLIAGEHSRAGWDVPAWAESAAASQSLIPGCGHLPMLERPAAFAQAVATALDGLRGSPH
ncbi:alpha/beta fold hydrolase [Pseudomonas benzenivorans]|uniref:alpha/beta fold hydrolase n=1 Tax=Pseudomonas benzenivorans TaxID=556533 RepID=UPI003517BBC5